MQGNEFDPCGGKMDNSRFAIVHAALLILSHPTFKPVRGVLIEISHLDNCMEGAGGGGAKAICAHL